MTQACDIPVPCHQKAADGEWLSILHVVRRCADGTVHLVNHLDPSLERTLAALGGEDMPPCLKVLESLDVTGQPFAAEDAPNRAGTPDDKPRWGHSGYGLPLPMRRQP